MNIALDAFGLGLLLGLLLGMCLFTSAQIAIGVVASTGAGVLPFVLTNGFDAFCRVLDGILKTVGSDFRLAGGLVFGIVIVGLMSVVFRKLAHWL